MNQEDDRRCDGPRKSEEYQTFEAIVKKAFSMKKEELDESMNTEKAARKKRQTVKQN
ncbi:MAG TPA: hypothetical protein VFA07_13710 [Chthonomonadaceae bacterium]|nr:hypothetical protein [Chthonomonadaceae bacterium]